MKTLIVTGGTGDLGSVVVPRLRQEYRCVLLVRREAEGEVVRADLEDESSVREALARVVEQYGAPYGLVHLAGGYAEATVSATSTETWQHMLSLNLNTSFFVIRETLARMRRDEPGRIVAISSQASLQKRPGTAAYAISKSGLNLLIELTAAELAATPITANALLPGILDTPMARQSMPNAPRVPLNRIADTILFLLSDAASSINGALIPMR